jgi:hypothetical protein
MGINAKIAKIPFFILYLILAGLTSFNWIRVILFQKDFEVFRTTQPWDYCLSGFFADTFRIAHQQYFLFAFPVVLIGLHFIPRLLGKLISLDKNSNVKGDNHIAIILILLTVPSILNLPIILGIVLIVLFSIWSWLDEQKAKKGN